MPLDQKWVCRGQRLKKARESKGLFLKDVSKLISKSVSTMSEYEQGRKRIDFDDIKTLCIFYDIDIRNF